MAVQTGGPSADLKSELLKEGPAFSFFQSMRLLRLYCRDADKEHDPEENIRVRPKLSLAFPPADVDAVEEENDPGSPRFRVTANFLGLYGISSPLPTFYTEELMAEEEEEAEGNRVTRDFIDVFNYRIYHLLFGCWRKYRQFIQVLEEEDDQYLERLFCLLGIGEAELRKNVPNPYSLLRYIGLFTQFPRSSSGLRALIQDVMSNLPLEVIPCVLRKARIPDDQQFNLGGSVGTLGVDTFVGEEIEDRMGRFRIRVGPLTRAEFRKILPGTEYYNRLAFLTRLYILEPLEYEMEVVLAKGEARKICLGVPEWSQLGVDTWAFSIDELGEMSVKFYPE